jgi:hypothetical protein
MKGYEETRFVFKCPKCDSHNEHSLESIKNTNLQFRCAALDFLHDGIEIVGGHRLEMADAFIGYSFWCQRQTLAPMEVATLWRRWKACVSNAASQSALKVIGNTC